MNLKTDQCRPIALSTAHTGMHSALVRLLGYHFTATERCTFPSWLCGGTIADAVYALGMADPCVSSSLLLKMKSYLNTRCVDAVTPLHLDGVPDKHSTQLNVSLMRVEFGAMLERIAIDMWSRMTNPDLRARIAHQSCLAACWTSIHVEHAHRLRTNPVFECEPGIACVPSQFSEVTIDHILDQRIVCGSSCKATHSLHQLLIRCTNPASRGWTTTLKNVLARMDGCLHILHHSLLVCLTGMHTTLSPSNRPHWSDRARILWRFHGEMTSARVCDLLIDNPAVTKELVRRRLVDALESSIALRHVMKFQGSLVASVGAPPRASLSMGIHESMLSITRVGVQYAQCDSRKIETLLHVAGTVPHAANWLKKVLLCHPSRSVVHETVDMSVRVFESQWTSFWTLCNQRADRPQRLDRFQYDALQCANPIVLMCNSLSETNALRIQRLVLGSPRTATFSTEHMLSTLFPRGCEHKWGDGGAHAHLEALIRSNASLSVATMLTAARVQWLGEQLLVIDMGDATRRKQSSAILKRIWASQHGLHGESRPTHIEAASDAQLASMLEDAPVHSTHLCVCTECHRIVNAMPTDSVSYTGQEHCGEVGVSSAMLSTEGITSDAHSFTMHCAKRSSAALRSALAYESRPNAMAFYQAEDWSTGECGQSVQKTVGSGATIHMRRDCRRAQVQRRVALPCGEQPLLLVQALGRAVRIYDKWYSMCAHCGVFTRIMHINRVGGEIVCTQCYRAHVWHSEESKVGEMAQSSALTRERRCRFCSKAVPRGDPTPFKSYASPLDTFGSNRLLPASLRITWWCPLHQRSWLCDTLNTLSTSQILVHISERACPVTETAPLQVAIPRSNTSRKRRTVRGMLSRAAKRRHLS